MGEFTVTMREEDLYRGFLLNAAMRNLRNKMERDDKDEKIVYLKKTAS